MADYRKLAETLINIVGEPVKRGIRAYHGSPYKFDRFSTQHIGTGEGAQAYGHGLYLAEHEPTALSYKNMPRVTDMDWPLAGTDLTVPAWVARSSRTPQGLDEVLQNFQGRLAESRAEQAAGDWNAAERIYHQQRIIDALEQAKRGGKFEQPGHMYEVNINARPEQFLDWDRPLGQQPGQVVDAVRGLVEPSLARQSAARETLLRRGTDAFGRPLDPARHARLEEPLPAFEEILGKDAYKRAGLPAKTASEGNIRAAGMLRDAGVPGIRYLDAGSRPLKISSPFPPQERATHNYVVFDDSLIDILKRYGIAAGIAPTAAGALGQGEQ